MRVSVLARQEVPPRLSPCSRRSQLQRNEVTDGAALSRELPGGSSSSPLNSSHLRPRGEAPPSSRKPPLAETPSKGGRESEQASERASEGARPPPSTFAPPFFSPRLFILCPRSQRRSLNNSGPPTPHRFTHTRLFWSFKGK